MSTGLGAVAVLALVPVLPLWAVALVLVVAGVVLGIGQPLSMTAITLAAPPGTPIPDVDMIVLAVGIVGLNLRAGLDLVAAAKVDAAFWIGDILKLVATGLVAAAVHRAFPWLLRRGA